MFTVHERAKEVFLLALSKPAADRERFLLEACSQDEALRDEVEQLLSFHDEGGPESYVPGHVFAGRYRMVSRLGRGGMGDVWRADDLVLETPVALKLIRSTSHEGRVHTLNEVRLARQITHPAVCRVFDVGEAGDAVFYSMELVLGEDLAALLKRVGRLPSEKVVDIAYQLCGGLAAAHAQGVLHRDLKPANVLIDENGLVRITDFGIAITREAAGRALSGGTPAYMAPEQRSSGAPLSEQTDLYALGVVLYQLVTGQHPFDRAGGATQPLRPSSLVHDVDPALEQILMKALSFNPADRPASAAAFAAGLPHAGAPTGAWPAVGSSAVGSRRSRAWLAGAAVAAVVAALTVMSPLVFSPASALTERDTIVLADFMNTTGDPVFDGTLKVALAVALEQSPFLKVFPDERIVETLRLMERRPEEPFTRMLAREVAQREQLKALIAGSIASLGTNYVMALEAVNAQTGDVMAREQVEVTGKEQVLTSLGAATSRLREKLGESLASIEQFDVALPRATTPSLDALHSYALALEGGRAIPRLEAIPHLQRALEIDPDFALAQALLSGVYTNTGQSELAPPHSRRAFELRDRVSERERFFISWRYYRDALQDWEQGLELARSWTSSYPREAQAFNSLGLALLTLARQDRGVTAFREAIRLDPRFVTPHANVAAALMRLNRFDEAKEALRQASASGFDFINIRQNSYFLAWIDGDSTAMAEHLAGTLATPEARVAFDWEALTSAFAGRIRMAHDQFRRASLMLPPGRFGEFAARFALEDAEGHAAVGQCTEARAETTAAIGASRDNFTLERASRYFAVCGAAAEASNLSSELQRRFPDATLVIRRALPVTAAAIAIERGDAARALELLEPVRPYDRATASDFWPAYLRGHAHIQLKNGAEAIADFQSILDHRGENPDSVLYPLAYLGLARAAALTGDVAQARKAYDDFFAVWKNADQDLRPVRDARQELARLSPVGSR